MLNSYLTLEKKFEAHKTLTYDILDGMVDWVRVIDNNGIVIYVNKSMREGLGFDIVGTNCYFSLGKKCACDRCIVQTTIATGTPAEKEERVKGKIFSVKSSPVKDADGNIYASVEVFRDVTRERKLENEIVKKNEKMKKDLEFARNLQYKILPKKGNYEFIDIDYIYKPSEYLSGDIFDILYLDDDNIGFYICDVVGHGVKAFMMTMFISQTIRELKQYKLSPSETLKQLHKRFLELNLDDDKYFTILYGVINRNENKLTFVNAGHNTPLVIISDKIKYIELTGYPITSLFSELNYKEEVVTLKENDEILLFTDGVTECRNEKGEEFGLDRIIGFSRNIKKDFLKVIYESAIEFNTGNLRDDFALVKATYKPKK